MDVQIVTRGIPASADEWFRALHTPIEELPAITEDDRKRARLRHLNDEQYRRHLTLRRLAKEREFAEGESLSRAASTMFCELGLDHRVVSVTKRGFESGWHLLIDAGRPREEWTASQTWDVYLGSDVLGADNLGASRQQFLTVDVLRPHLMRQLGLEDKLRATC